jgi:hypothetical protein
MRRRSDDWRVESPIRLSRQWFTEITSRLGYDPASVASVRMNQTEIVVTHYDGATPVTVRHRLNQDGETDG